MEHELDPRVWFGERELPFTPSHFTVATTKLTLESKLWILDNLKGRFSCVQVSEEQEFDTFNLFIDSVYGSPAFEDPAEATLYELKWS